MDEDPEKSLPSVPILCGSTVPLNMYDTFRTRLRTNNDKSYKRSDFTIMGQGKGCPYGRVSDNVRELTCPSPVNNKIIANLPNATKVESSSENVLAENRLYYDLFGNNNSSRTLRYYNENEFHSNLFEPQLRSVDDDSFMIRETNKKHSEHVVEDEFGWLREYEKQLRPFGTVIFPTMDIKPKTTEEPGICTIEKIDLPAVLTVHNERQYARPSNPEILKNALKRKIEPEQPVQVHQPIMENIKTDTETTNTELRQIVLPGIHTWEHEIPVMNELSQNQQFVEEHFRPSLSNLDGVMLFLNIIDNFDIEQEELVNIENDRLRQEAEEERLFEELTRNLPADYKDYIHQNDMDILMDCSLTLNKKEEHFIKTGDDPELLQFEAQMLKENFLLSSLSGRPNTISFHQFLFRPIDIYSTQSLIQKKFVKANKQDVVAQPSSNIYKTKSRSRKCPKSQIKRIKKQ